MKLLIKSILFTAVISSTFLSSCNKYEEGPKISFASKKSRLCGDWKLEKFMHNSTDQTSAATSFYGANFVWGIEKDGKYTQAGTYSDSGTWKLGEDKDDVTFTSNTPVVGSHTFRILRLKSKELWMKETKSNGDIEEWHLKQ